MDFRYLTLEEILAIHERVLADHGGLDGVRDVGMVQSAVAQPLQGFGDADLYPDLPSKAAALLFSLCMNHPFTDGNKRVAAAGCETFLLLNGYSLSLDNDEFASLVLAVADGSVSREELTNTLRATLVAE